MADGPDAKKARVPQAQDFIKGWPNADLLTYPQLKEDLKASFEAFLNDTGRCLNYGDAQNGGYMLGMPDFRQALATFLSEQYGKPCDWNTIFATGGGSMGTDIIARVHSKPGDYAVSEAPTYYLAHDMMRNSGLNLLDVPIQEDGMDMDKLEQVCKDMAGKVKLVYTVPVHHNPTGITMSNPKRERLLKLAKQYDFKIISDEAYQLLNYSPSGVLPLFYNDDPADPRVFSVGTLSKLIGPGTKVGWVQAYPAILKPLADIGFVNSGNNPVIFASSVLTQFITSGNLAKHIAHVSPILAKKKDLMVEELKKVGLEPNNPGGGYFVWVKAKDKRTGRTGKGMSLEADEFAGYMRLCFAWLTEEQIVEGIEYLKA
jgi:DNA-binding transcriptional MocR family regulator